MTDRDSNDPHDPNDGHVADRSADSGPSALRLESFRLAHRRSKGELVLLESVDLELPAGGFYLLLGESGSGKSTLLRLLTGLIETREPAPKLSGRAWLLGTRIDRRFPNSLHGRVAAVLQDEGLLDELSPLQNVELALDCAGRSRKLALGLLSQAGLADPPRQVASLSGGMRKRVAIARAIALDPELFIFDEPTAGLDPSSGREMAELLVDVHRRARGSRTTIVITHEADLFEDLADGVLTLDRAHRTLVFDRAKRSAKEDSDRVTQSPDDESVGEFELLGARRFLLQVSALVQTLVEAGRHLPPLYLSITARTTLRYTVESVLFTVLACVTIGGLATFFSLQNNPLESAFTNQLLTGVGKVLTAVLVPLMGGFFFTARMAAGAAARIGTMKRTNQIAALKLLGIHPADYLLNPLVWAMCIAMPVTTAAGVVASAAASFGSYNLLTGEGPYGWAMSYFRTVEMMDMRLILLKTTISGFLVAVLTYHLGSGPKRSGREVGLAVNSSIVFGMVIVLLVHAILTIIGYAEPL